jgi:hypothetical protein
LNALPLWRAAVDKKMLWRGLVYLALIAPLHYLIVMVAVLPAMLLLPPDIVPQLILALPLYAAGLWWGVPLFQRLLGLLPAPPLKMRLSVSFIGFMTLALLLLGIFFGITTPREATVLGSALLTTCHLWLIRSALQR